MTEFERLVTEFERTGMAREDAEEAAAIATGEHEGCIQPPSSSPT